MSTSNTNLSRMTDNKNQEDGFENQLNMKENDLLNS